MPRFMITVRATSGDTFTGALGPIRYLSVPEGTTPAPSHAISRTAWVKQVMQTFPADAQGRQFGSLLFFVHGFNVTAAGVAADHDAIAAGLAPRFACTIVSFDWPSAGETYAYLPDLDLAARSAIDLVNAGIKPLVLAQTDKCRVAIHALCHSMGAFVVREALDHADRGTVTGSDWALNQLVLIAGDVAASDFAEGDKETESMFGHCYRLTNYFNKYDEVLQISNAKRAGTEPRAGRVGLPPDAPAKAVNVDCSAYFATLPKPADPTDALLFSHGWYFHDPVFYTDLAETLLGAVDRTVVAARGSATDGRTLTLT